MARHSKFNEVSAPKSVCGCPILPIKTQVKGPAPAWGAADDEDDIVDEAISLFRCNVLHRNFEVNGGGDRILIYLTLYITQCLQTVEKSPNAKEAEKQLQALSWANFKVPGEADFPVSGFFSAPANAAEGDAFRAYFKQVREETGRRLISVVFPNPADKASKFWLAFGKRKFMNKNL